MSRAGWAVARQDRARWIPRPKSCSPWRLAERARAAAFAPGACARLLAALDPELAEDGALVAALADEAARCAAAARP